MGEVVSADNSGANRWAAIERLFIEATAIERADRGAFLDTACNGDTDLRREVETLLASDEQAEKFIEAPAMALAGGIMNDSSIGLEAGRRIGPYQIIRELDHGGMGTVYLATRADNQYEKLVAIKVVRPGLDTEDIRRRFRHERQILASLDHPNIAKLIDGGATEDGLPYFVMEYIDGLPITRYCDGLTLTTAERLQLFRTICAAVQYAHQRLIIHRDLKPGNILVTQDGTAKLLDFGIAKLLNPAQEEGGAQTVTQLGVMTPDYASPEQIQGSQVTTASDVYSLGVVLYELLTGYGPYRLKSRRPDELLRAICDEEPEKPSYVVSHKESVGSSIGDAPLTAESISHARGDQPGGLRRKLKGDLDNIALMALRKEPLRRYASAEQFSEDIRRYLEGLPVRARNDTFSYRAGKFINRHRLGAAATALVLLGLIIGIAAILRESAVARQERNRARTEAAKSTRISAFLEDTLGAAAPEARGGDVRVVELLDDATQRAAVELQDQPEVMASVLLTIGKTYNSLGLMRKAENILRTALAASEKINDSNQTTASCMTYMAITLSYSKYEPEAEGLARRAVEVQRKLYPQGQVEMAQSLYALGVVLLLRGAWEEAEPLLQKALELCRANLPSDHGYAVAVLNQLAEARRQASDVNGAENVYRQSIEIGRGLNYRHRVWLAQALFGFGRLLNTKKDFGQAETALSESSDVYAEIGGESFIGRGYALNQLGITHFQKGEYRKAELELKKSIDIYEKSDFRENLSMASAKGTLGIALTRLNKPAEGEPYLRDALRIRKTLLPNGSVISAETTGDLGESLSAQRRYSEAEPLLLGSYNALRFMLGEQDSNTVTARQRLAKLYAAWAKPQLTKQFMPTAFLSGTGRLDRAPL